jgi:hypothetical protein
MRFRLVLVAALAFSACGGRASSPAPATPVAVSERPVVSSHVPGRLDCSTQSTASFPGAFTDPHNLVAGPLVLVGGAFTDAQTVRDFGGNKFPLLVQAGHTVSIRLGGHARTIAGLAYGPLHAQGREVKLRDTYRRMTFVACPPGTPMSDADGAEVTFWSGFVLTREPACIPLRIAVDGGPPRRVPLSLGVRC